MKLSFLRQPALMGVDIKPDKIRMIQLKKTAWGFFIEQASALDLPSDIFFEGKIRQWDKLGMYMEEWVNTLGIKDASVALSLPAHLVCMQHISLRTGLSPAEIESEIYAYLQHDLTDMQDALCIDYLAIPKAHGQQEIFFSAVREEYLTQYVNCINTAGLTVKIVDVDIYALKRAAYFNLQEEEKQAVSALVQVNDKEALLMITSPKEIIFHHRFEVEINIDFAVQLKQRLQLFLATFRQINIIQCIFCGPQKYFTQLLSDPVPWQWQLKRQDFFTNFKLSADLHPKLLGHYPYDFLTACGLAMREVPLW